MRIYDLFHQLVERFVPMEISTKTELQTGAVNSYNSAVVEAKKLKLEAEDAVLYNKNLAADELPAAVPKLKIQHKVILQCEMWYMRYLFAILYIYLVPKVKSYMNGDAQKSMMEDDESEDEWSRFQSFKRFNRGL